MKNRIKAILRKLEQRETLTTHYLIIDPHGEFDTKGKTILERYKEKIKHFKRFNKKPIILDLERKVLILGEEVIHFD